MSGAFFEDDDYEGARDRYLGGGCHALALAVHERTRWDLAVVWVARGRRTEIAHALAIVPGEDELYLDVGGVRGLPEILDDLGIDPEDEEATVEEPVDAARILALMRGSHAHRRFASIGPDLEAHAASTADRLIEALDIDCSIVAGPRP